MKNITFLSLLLFLCQTMSAQVTITGAHTSSNGDYTTLQNAFNAINAYDQTANTISVEITSSFTDDNTATLNSGNWNSLSIYPTADNITISGSVAAPLIDINGASNVTFDGRVNMTGSDKSLIIQNTSTSTASYEISTIRFINGVSDNTIKYCIIKGAARTSASNFTPSACGNIYISTGGNSDILIENNDLTSVSTTERPYNCIYSKGLDGELNSDITIRNNHFYDIFYSTPGWAYHYMSGIYLHDYTTNCTIDENHFYQNESETIGSANEHNFIAINSSTGSDFTITNNYMGGQGTYCSGDYYSVASATSYYFKFRTIRVRSAETSTNRIDGNVIRNISINAKGDYSTFTAFQIDAGKWDIGTNEGNIVGSDTGNTSILMHNLATDSGDDMQCIPFWISNGIINVQNNKIGGITMTSDGGYFLFYGIWSQASGTTNIDNNLFGSVDEGTSSSIQLTSPSVHLYMLVMTLRGGSSNSVTNNTISKIKSLSTTSSGYMIGIENLRSGTPVSNNVIRDIVSSSTITETDYESALIGISMRSSTFVYDNEIYNLSNINDNFEGQVIGVYKTGFYACTVNRNFIHDLTLTGTNVGNAKVFGGLFEGGSAIRTNNNVIVLSDDNTNYVYGIFDNLSSGQGYHYLNTIYFEGNPPLGTSPSYCFYINSSNFAYIKDNIFYNNKSTTGGSNLHYAAGFNHTATTGFQLDYNNYYAPGTGGVLGYWNSTNRTSLPIITGHDGNSYSQDPQFLNEGSTNPTDYFPINSLWGTNAGITDDFAGNERGNPPYIGAFEVVPEVIWTGATSTDWNTTSNWNHNILPADGTNAIIPNVSVKPVITNGVAGVSKILTINSGSNLTINPGGSLTIHEEIANSGTINLESNASGDASLIVEGTLSGSGTYNVQRYLSGSQWHLVTSPITAGTAGVFEDIWLRPYDESTNEFGEYITPTATPMPTGQGFSVWADANETRTFTGTINHGAVGPFSAQLTGVAGANTGWNLMGNPYPSAIDWYAGSGWTKTNLNNSVYVWNSTQYATFVAGVGNNGGSRYIAPGQGFFVQANAAGASLSMNNDVQVHNSVNFLKNTQSDPDNTIRIQVSADGYQDENVIVIRDANANAFDPQVDAYKLPGSADAPQMHIEKDDFSELSIASFPQIQDIEDKVLNIDYALEGTHTLLWSHTCTENTPALLDQQTGQIVEPGSNYTFTASFSEMEDRFVFATDLLSIQDKLNELDVWEYNNTVFVKSNTNDSQISVINMQGVEVYSNTGNTFNLNHLSPAMYVVKVKSGEQSRIEKIVIK